MNTEQLFGQIAINIKEGKNISGNQFKYKLGKPIGSGLGGVVYRATCAERQFDAAIKFFLPLYNLKHHQLSSPESQKQAMEDSINFQRKELQCLEHVHHTNIVRILDNGIYKVGQGELINKLSFFKEVNFIVTDFVPGSNIKKYLESNKLSASQIASMLMKISDALYHLHNIKKYMHADIKAENIIIRNDTNEPVIIDFSLYKNFNFNEVENNNITNFTVDWDLFPTKFLQDGDNLLEIRKQEKGYRNEIKLLSFPGLDLYQFGLLLQNIHEYLSELLPEEEMRFINLLIDELTSWQRVIKLDTSWLKEQISKLDPAYSQFMGVEELTPASSAKKTIQLPGRVITLSPLIDNLLNTRSLQRLRAIKQLGFLELLYPAAGYPRYVHCMRAYGFCVDCIESLTHNPQFRLLFSGKLAKQALAISLLHDINHFPFLHIFQEIRDEYKMNIDILDFFCKGESTKDSPSIYEILNGIGLSREQFRDIFLLKHERLIDAGYEPGLQIVKSLIDSGADIDKLAYLSDDSFFTGVAYGQGIDSARLISSATIIKTPVTTPKKPGWHIGFLEKGLPAVESLLITRYWMFRTIYWHRLNRAIIAMLIHVIRKLYVFPKIDASDLVIDTMWQSEEAILKYLNDKYFNRYSSNSITQNILRDRSTIYKKLLSIRGDSSDSLESEIYEEFYKADLAKREKCRKEFIKIIEDYLRKTFGVGLEITDDDLLLDIPGRRLDTAGPIFIELDNGEVKPIALIDGPIKRLISDFEKLTKNMRVFINPKIINKIDKFKLISKRSEIMALFEKAMPRDNLNQVK
jgi:HD superfamily phosphohydrolase